MVKFRNYLDGHKIPWEDTSDIKWISFGIEEAFADTPIYRTKFEYRGTTYTVISGYRQSTRFNEGLLEVRNRDTTKLLKQRLTLSISQASITALSVLTRCLWHCF